MKDINYYRCPVCGNVIEVVNGDVSRVRCCGRELELLNSNVVDGIVAILDNGKIVEVGRNSL